MTIYSPEEIQAIASTPMTIGTAIALVDMGIISTAIEATAMTKAIVGAAQRYPNNSIIQAAFSVEALKSVKFEKPDIKPDDLRTGVFVDQAIAQAQQVVAMLQAKATHAEIVEYKQFIYDCGETVANAAGSGLFGTGTKVSPQEAATLDKLKTALGL